MKRKATLLLLALPSVALAEVSDKMASVPEIYVQGLVAAAIAFFASRLRWWLVFVAVGWALLLALGLYGLWQEKHMREAVLHEQGIKYFVALLLEVGLVIGGGTLGVLSNQRARRAQQGIQRDGPASGGSAR